MIMVTPYRSTPNTEKTLLLPEGFSHSTFAHHVRKCHACSRRQSYTNPIPPDVGMGNHFTFVGRDPGVTENQEGIPFHPDGQGGKEFRKYLEVLELDRRDIYVTNLLFCYATYTPTNEEITTCFSRFKTVEWQLIHPRFVFLMSNPTVTAFFPGVKSTLYLTKDVFKVRDTYYIPLIHPGYIRRKPALQSSFYRSLKFVRDFIKEVDTQGASSEKA